MIKLLAVIGVVAMLMGCASNGQIGQRTAIGGLGGAAAGGLLASVFGGGVAGIAAGTILGGLVGGAVGNLLDQNDKTAINNTTNYALNRGQTGVKYSWQNPETGHGGYVAPTSPRYRVRNTYCREFQQVVTVGGEEQRAYGRACKTPGGDWNIGNY
jgi:surface antigen